MGMIRHEAPARVGLLGNPSDGYGGKTLALAVPRYQAVVELEPSDGAGFVIESAPADRASWASPASFVEQIDRLGYGTGVQLLAATVRTFVDVADTQEWPRPDGFVLRYHSTIPRQVGLAGSSALVVAGLRCLADFVGGEIPELVLPSIALGVETEQLGITAGLQDRVVQTLGGLVAMDFSSLEVDARFGVGHGRYESLDPSGLPPLFLAYREAAAASSGEFHGRLRARFDRGEPLVLEVMRSLAHLVIEGKAALRWGDTGRLVELVGQNMELRRSLGPLPEQQLALVDIAEAAGATATFSGSGGAVVGACTDGDHRRRVLDAYAADGVAVVPLD